MTNPGHVRNPVFAASLLLAAASAHAAAPVTLNKFKIAVGVDPIGLTEANGLLYGILTVGGSLNGGSVYSFNPAKKKSFNLIYSFGTAEKGDGDGPVSSPI